MTQEKALSAQEVVDVTPFETKATALLSPDDLRLLLKYKEDGHHRLATKTSAGLFELYLNGSTTREIHELNPTLPYPAILWSRIDESWDEKRSQYVGQLQEGIRDRLIKSQLETVGLLSDLLNVASKHHGAALKKYLQTGEKDHLKGIIEIESITMMLRVIEGLQKLTGQANTFRVKTDDGGVISGSLPAASATPMQSSLSSEETSQILAIVANAKRKAESAKKIQ